MSEVNDIPTTRAEFLAVLRGAPFGIFTKRERDRMEALLHLEDTEISEIMHPADQIVYLEADEMLGPKTLDRLYRSGLTHFPVKNAAGDLIGAVHTAHLNSLEIRDGKTAAALLDPSICYLRDDYNFEQALEAFLRTETPFALVVNKYGQIVGLLNFSDLCHQIFGQPGDGFSNDTDRLSVANRGLPIDLDQEPYARPAKRRRQPSSDASTPSSQPTFRPLAAPGHRYHKPDQGVVNG